MLNAAEPKIVNGPEILNKYVGASEENVRELFKDAEKEQAEKGEDSSLHVIIFDEIDAICKQRGSVSSGTGVHDTVVNQLLTKIDGVDALNNILLIGKPHFHIRPGCSHSWSAAYWHLSVCFPPQIKLMSEAYRSSSPPNLSWKFSAL